MIDSREIELTFNGFAGKFGLGTGTQFRYNFKNTIHSNLSR